MYLAASPAGALVEVIVHLEIRDGKFPPMFQLLKAHAPDAVSRETLDPDGLRPGWVEDTRITRVAGDQWIADGRTALLEIPSVIVPETANFLLNPVHPDARQITIEWHKKFPVDGRLFRPRK